MPSRAVALVALVTIAAACSSRTFIAADDDPATGGGGAPPTSPTASAATTSGTGGGPATSTGAGGHGSPGTCLWQNTGGPAGFQSARDVAVDHDDNVILVGRAGKGLDLGCGLLTPKGAWDGFVAKLDGAGTCLWQKVAGSEKPAKTTFASVAVAPSGAILLAGQFTGSVDLGCGPLTSAGDADVFVVALDGSGACQWQRRAGNEAEQRATSVAVGSDGSVFIAGSFAGSLDFGCGVMASDDFFDMYLAKLDSSGNCLWQKSTGDHPHQFASEVMVSASGDVLVSGTFDGAMDLGCGPVDNGQQDYHWFVARLDAAGSCQWHKQAVYTESINVGAGANVTTIVEEAGGNLLIGGWFGEVMDIGCGSVTHDGYGPFVARLTPLGECVWQPPIMSDQAYVSELAQDLAGNTFVSGSFEGTIDFGCGPLMGVATTNGFVAKLSPEGTCEWQQHGAGSKVDAFTLAVDSAGHAYVAGQFGHSVDWGCGASFVDALQQVFLAKLHR